MADHFAGRIDNASSDPQKVKVPEKSITRLRSYLFALDDYLAQGAARVSSDDISRKVGIKAHLIRRDLSQFGEFGRPSIGYDAAYLRTRLGQILHIDDSKDILWVGSSRLSQDSLLIKRFQDHGFNIVALFDTGTPARDACVGGLPVKPFTHVISTVSELGAQAAVLAVSQPEAQAAADVLISAGIKGILNLTSAVIVAPHGVCVRNVDIVAELLALSYYCHGMHDSD
jgi:redox-sensing transcriptional repressor